ncbi:MAG: bifunctional aldolase/short-chain dehydrogenase [Gammaproteobacteria bacterium]|nr:bifunctional aldolase/short-chain dehydrogenase [Gammaproteobacteria bacterium]MYG95887.1 bifunctional aldolase/short-chain dehydrogenase [Gammaproteobacteria bacterium]
MKNRWNKQEARACANQLELRAYSSRLLGRDPSLVLHGGGNTSVKGELTDVFGETRRVLFVKGSGWDLKSIGAAGFAPTDLDYLLRLAELEQLSDSEMMRQLRLATLDPAAPNPSVEAILHALIPHRYVDHTHADAVVTLSNSPDGERILRELYGDEVLVLPYIMPGFILARQVAAATRDADWDALRGIVLLQHGIFSFHEDAEGSYEAMIELVDRAESELLRRAGGSPPPVRAASPDAGTPLQFSRLRKAAGEIHGLPMLARLDAGPEATDFAQLDDCGELIRRGPLTPDHTLHAKPFGAVFDADPLPGLRDFEQEYLRYFSDHADENHQCLDAAPRYGVWRNKAMIYLAPNCKRLEIVADISAHTIRAIRLAEAIGGWRTLPREKLFEVEYWELEQAKLAKARAAPELQGKIALVTGAASGIGRATVEELRGRGATVIALDIDEMEGLESPEVLCLRCDVTDSDATESALSQGVLHFGGLDILVSNAGNFPASANLAEMTDAAWEQSMQLNLGSHMKVLRACLPLLENGFDPAVVFVASKNVPAPGPGAAAYSAAKAGLTQLARVAALEAGPLGIRVNVVHPNAVYDTGIWTEEVLSERARRYSMDVEQYRTSNLLGLEVSSRDVAASIVSLAGAAFSRTTGAQVPVDGGNERVI